MYSSNLIKYPRGVSSTLTSYGRERCESSHLSLGQLFFTFLNLLSSQTPGEQLGQLLEGRSVTRVQNNDGTETGNELGVEELIREKKREK